MKASSVRDAWPTRALGAVRRSMTARISLSIVLVALLLVVACGELLDSLVARELRDQMELQLLEDIDFVREDLREAGGDASTLSRRLDQDERRTHVTVRLTDDQGRALSRSAHAALPEEAASAPEFDGDLVPPVPQIAALRELRAVHPELTSLWSAPDGRQLRVLRASITLAPLAGTHAATATPIPARVHVLLAIEAGKTQEVRRGEMHRLLIALAVAGAIAAAVGAAIARAVLAEARRLGAAAERIGANALKERLPLDEVPFELEDSARAFNRMLDRLDMAFERLSRFSAEVAHDLRTPIGNLLGEAQVALSRARSADEYRAVLESAVEEYERMSRMIGNMLFLARTDNAQTALDRRVLRLDRLLERVTAYFELVAEERSLSLLAEVDAAPGVEPVLHADDSLVTRALGNLLSNALRHASDGTRVTVRARAHADGTCTIAVENTGKDIPPEHLPHLLERFYRIESSREGSAGGSGLGLAIVESIMALHGGSVEVRSAGGVTVFSLSFPSARAV